MCVLYAGEATPFSSSASLYYHNDETSVGRGAQDLSPPQKTHAGSCAIDVG